MTDIYQIKECPDCGSSEIIHNEKKQHVICKDCNVIYEPLTPKEEDTYLHHKPGSKKPEVKKEPEPKSKARVKAESKPKKSAQKIKVKTEVKVEQPKVRRR